MSDKPRMLIEVAMPVKEVSFESVRDKSIRHGHISTLHIWWARRPLPVCRATVFASLVPDPEDEFCPQAFLDAVDLLIGSKSKEPFRSAYKPYEDIPHTAVVDKMPDTRRNRLLMLIGKFSEKYVQNDRLGKKTDSKETLSDFSLIKWETRENEEVLNITRKLIWVAHNAELNTLDQFDNHWKAIQATRRVYTDIVNPEQSVEALAARKAYDDAVEAFQNRMPRVFDPFAGGGAIPLEAARLGCRSYGNDINPVAHIIQRASLEFPQKFGQPIVYTQAAYELKYGEDAWKKLPVQWKDYDGNRNRIVRIPNRLSHDVEHEALALLSRAEEKIGHLYPKDDDGNKPIAYYWARTATCSNPSCGAKVPLLKQFYLAKTSRRKVHLKPVITGTQIDFQVVEGVTEEEGWNKRGNLTCPCCSQVTTVKQIKTQSNQGQLTPRLLAVIWDQPRSGKSYRIPRKKDINPIGLIPDVEEFRPIEGMQRNSAGGDTFSWGISKWGQMFSDRQLLAMQTLVESIPDELKTAREGSYEQALVAYIGVFIDRVSATSNSFGRIDVTRESFQTPFARQAIPMIFDYPEINLFSGGSGCAANQLEWILRYCNGENHPFSCAVQNAASGDKQQFDLKSLDAVVTDPPYYDAIAYADLSDFFYVWLKRTVGLAFPLAFITPQTPKSGECTALKHHHDGDGQKAEKHFEDMLASIFEAIEHQTDGAVSIMFAHQSTKAWSTLCNSVLHANLSMNGSWAIDTEMSSRSLAIAGDALTSSVTVACRPVQREGIADFKDIKTEIGEKVKAKVRELYGQGFRGADLLTACFGHAVGVFGKYQSVEKSDGSEVGAEELLELTRELAYSAIVSDFPSDSSTQFYLGWLQLFGAKPVKYDDLRKIAQIGLNVDLKQLDEEGILEDADGLQQLVMSEKRIISHANTGNQVKSNAIDKCHRMMHFWKLGNRRTVLELIERFAPTQEHELWRVMNALFEVLPNGSDDHKQAGEILSALESLLREAKQSSQDRGEQTAIEF